jgi:small subunit ribosomal protein S6
MPLYEHVFISRQDLSNVQAESLVEHFSTILTENGGTVVESEYWGLKTMAYKIKKNRKGHYSFFKVRCTGYGSSRDGKTDGNP